MVTPRWLFIVGLALAPSLGCASRSLGPEPQPGSALASDAAAGHAPKVTTVLSQDPPLPGESTAGWSGLEEPASETHAHDDHTPPTEGDHGAHHGH